jgi:hypothetical protein
VRCQGNWSRLPWRGRCNGSIRWQSIGEQTCDGAVRSNGQSCACPRNLAQRRAAAKHGEDCKPGVSICFRLRSDPALGMFGLLSEDWSFAETVIDTGGSAATNGPVAYYGTARPSPNSAHATERQSPRLYPSCTYASRLDRGQCQRREPRACRRFGQGIGPGAGHAALASQQPYSAAKRPPRSIRSAGGPTSTTRPPSMTAI